MNDDSKTKKQLTAEIQQLRQRVAELELQQHGCTEAVAPAQQPLSELERQWRLIMDAAPALIAYVDAECRYRRVNRQYERRFGRPAEEIEDRYVWDVVGETDWEEVRPYVNRALAGEAVTFEWQLPYSNGERRWALFNYSPDFDASGRVCGFVVHTVDITGRKQAEEELRKSEARANQHLAELEAIYRSAHIGLCIFDRNLRYVRINERLAELNDLAAADHIGRTIHEVIPSIANQAEGIVHQIVETGKPVLNVELIGTTSSQPDAPRTFISHWLPLRDAHGNISEINVAAEDITESKQAEETLKQSKEQLRLALDAARMGTWDWDIISGRLFWNEEFFRILGYDPTRVEPSYQAWSARVHPEDRLSLKTQLRRSKEWCSDYQAEYRLLWPDETVRWAESRGRFEPDSSGKASRSYGVVMDITERKQAEEKLRESESRYRELVQNVNSAILRYKSDGIITFFNEYAQAFFGYRAEEMIGKHLKVLLPERESTGLDLTQLVEDIVEQPQRFVNTINENICRDGRRVWMAWTNKPILDEQARVVEILAVGTDITERVQAEEALRNLKEMTANRISAVEKQVSIGRLAAGVAHEINNPLTAILSLSMLMQQNTPDDDEKREDLDIIVTETKRCREIVRSLLDFARESPAHRTVVDINQIARETVLLASKYDAMDRAEVIMDLSPTPLHVYADSKMIQQVLTNLLLNAAEALDTAGTIRMKIEKDSSGDFVHVHVTDTGKGIPKEDFDRIFEPFFTTKGPGRGTGLGLSVSFGIMQKHDGTIEIHSEEGVGTTVTIVLPKVSEP